MRSRTTHSISEQAASAEGKGPRENRKVCPRLGQGLLETVIAIGIITSGLLAILTLVASNARASEVNALRLGAVAAAREGVEAVRAIRDANWLAGRVWNDGIAGSGTDYSAIAVFDPAAATWTLGWGANARSDSAARIIRRTDGADVFLTQDASGGTGAGLTLYRRLLSVDPVCEAADGTRVTVTSGSSCGADRTQIGLRAQSEVTWVHRGQPQRAVVEEMLYDWR